MEIFKDIPWYEWHYQAGNMWTIKSLWRQIYRWTNKDKWLFVKEIIMKWIIDKDWYLRYQLSKDSKYRKYWWHKLVLLAFLWEVVWKPITNHKNWIKDDNRLENLEWCTASENWLHSYRVLWNIPFNKWKIWILCKLSRKIGHYDLNWNLLWIYYWIRDVERKTWINKMSVNKQLLWKVSKPRNHIFKYL